MADQDAEALVRVIAGAAQPLRGGTSDLDPLMDLIADRRCVLIGEATHGTHEFYRLRAELTRRLIVERGFDAVAVEGDWPDAYRVNRYVRGLGRDAEPRAALGDFERFPRWMWRNTVVLDFVRWLRAYDDVRGAEDKVGFYGLDLYSLHASIDAVLRYLERVDPGAAQRARARYACFDHFAQDAQAYGYATSLGLQPDCEREVVGQLLELQRERAELLRNDGLALRDQQFEAEQNARVVKNAEEYYRAMFAGRVSSWNLRDTHMADTLDALLAHLGRDGRGAKVVVWAHNSHVGDARATELGEAGELNLGQLARERHGDDAVLIGLTTYAGTVTAASGWDEPAEQKRVRPGLDDGHEALFHRADVPELVLRLDGARVGDALRAPRLQRAIGVVYRPQSERQSHYFHARLADQFDAILHLDRTRALEPLDVTAGWERGELPDTYPTGM